MTARELLQAILDGKTIVHRYSNRELKLLKTNDLSQDGMVFDLSCPNYWYIKPEVLLINGIEVPKPESVAPQGETMYYYVVLDCTGNDNDYEEAAWISDAIDKQRLILGIVHLTKEAASKHAQALLSFTKVGSNV
jgi:hypothetical protein